MIIFYHAVKAKNSAQISLLKLHSFLFMNISGLAYGIQIDNLPIRQANLFCSVCQFAYVVAGYYIL